MVTHTTPTLQIRAVRPSDAVAVARFLEGLSERSYYRRFSAPQQPATAAELDQLTDPDTHDGVRWVAMDLSTHPHSVVGLAQLFGPVGAEVAEGALVVADPQQRRGLGSTLCRHLLRLARERRVGRVWGLVQRDNHTMLRFARKNGYPVRHGELGYEICVPVCQP